MGYFRENIEKLAGYESGFQPKKADVVKQLRVAYERRYADVSRQFDEYCPIVIGADRLEHTDGRDVYVRAAVRSGRVA